MIEGTCDAILEDCSALLEERSLAFPHPDDSSDQSVRATLITLWLARDHGIHTIRWMSQMFQNDMNAAVLACTILRAFYENAVRMLWACRQPNGWQRLYAYYASEKEKWANEARTSQNPGIVKLANDDLKWVQQIKQQKDFNGNPIEPAPKIRQILVDIEAHEQQTNPSAGRGNWGQEYYTYLYRILCRPSHAHIEAVTGEVDDLYVSTACVGALIAAVNLLQAFIHQTSTSPKDDISSMLKAFWPLLQRCKGNKAAPTTGEITK